MVPARAHFNHCDTFGAEGPETSSFALHRSATCTLARDFDVQRRSYGHPIETAALQHKYLMQILVNLAPLSHPCCTPISGEFGAGTALYASALSDRVARIRVPS